MNQVLIISDSHGLSDDLTTIKKRHQNIPYFIHCGDSELSEDSQYLKGYATVSGNCDWNGKFPNDLLIEVDDIKIFVTHGHLYGVKMSLAELKDKATSVGAQIACSGHSHIAFAEMHDDVLMINPGSIRLPRLSKIPTYAILSWSDKSEVTVQFYDPDGQIIEGIADRATFKLKDS